MQRPRTNGIGDPETQECKIREPETIGPIGVTEGRITQRIRDPAETQRLKTQTQGAMDPGNHLTRNPETQGIKDPETQNPIT